MNSPLASQSPLFGSAQSKTTEASPREIRLASGLFVLVGVGYLFPFSALTQPVDYWKILFPDFNIEFALTSVYMYTNLVMLALLVFCGGEPSFTPRIVGGFIGQLMVLIFVPTSYFFITSEAGNVAAILGATAFAAIVTAFLDSSVIALASQYPLRVQEAFQMGIGISTLIGSLYRDLTKLIFPPDAIVESSLLYFYTGAVTIAICIGAYFLLIKMPFSQQCLDKAKDAELELEAMIHSNEKSPLLSESGKMAPTKRQVLRKIWFNELMVSLLFISTLSLWPPLVTEIKSYNFPALQASGWWSLLLLTGFSIMDCCGRFVVQYRGPLTRDNIWVAVLLRFLFFPLIICAVKGIIFTHDFWSMLFVAGLGFTNGYIGTLTIVMVNECIEPEEQAIAGMFTSFFLNSGLVLGATTGLIVEQLVIG